MNNDSDRLDLLECLINRGIFPHQYNSGSAVWIGVQIDYELIAGANLRDCLDLVYENQNKNEKLMNKDPLPEWQPDAATTKAERQ